MISPHLLRVNASYSFLSRTVPSERKLSPVKMIDKMKEQAQDLWGDKPMLVIATFTGSHVPTWGHIVWATGPSLDGESEGSELVIIWLGEMGPDTERVLDIVDWEIHAKDFTNDT